MFWNHNVLLFERYRMRCGGPAQVSLIGVTYPLCTSSFGRRMRL